MKNEESDGFRTVGFFFFVHSGVLWCILPLALFFGYWRKFIML